MIVVGDDGRLLWLSLFYSSVSGLWDRYGRLRAVKDDEVAVVVLLGVER